MNKDDTTNTNKIHSNTWLIWTLILLLLLGLAAIFAAKENLVRFLNVDVNKDKTVVIGQRGADGKAGLNGLDGNSGSSGQNGSSGSSGAAGANGAQGVPGSNDCISGICVSRQASTPGTQEAGNINIDGAVIAAQAGIGTNSPSNTLSVAGTANFGGHTATGAGATVNGITSASDAISGATAHNTIAAVYETVTTLDSATTMYEGLGGVLKLNPSSAPLFNQLIGNNGGVEVVAGNAENFTGNITGMNGSIIHSGTGTATTGVGLQGVLLNLSTGTISSGYGLRSIGINLNPGGSSGTITNYVGIESSFAANAGTITNHKGIQIQTPNNFGTITNNYGLYIQDQSSVGSSNSYNIYSAGATSKNYFAGLVGIGADTTPDASLEIVNDGSGDSFLVADTNDADTTPFVINSGGNVGIGISTPGAALGIGSTGSSGLVVLRSASTVNGVPTEADPVIVINRLVTDGGPASNSTGAIYFGNYSSRIWRSGNTLTMGAYGGISIAAQEDINQTVLTVKGMMAQGGNLQEWQDSTGTVIGSFNIDDSTGNKRAKLTLGKAGIDYGPTLALNGASGPGYAGGLNWNIISAGPADYFSTGALTFIDNSNGEARVAFQKNGTNVFRAKPGQAVNLQEWQNSSGTPLSVVDSSGYIGVGTTAPQAEIEISQSATWLSSINIKHSGSNKAISIGTTGGATSNWNVENASGLLYFYNTNLSETSLDLADNGNVGIGTNFAAPSSKLTVKDSASAGSVLSLQNTAGTCTHTPTAGAETVSCSSDERLKTDIVDAASVLSEINGLKIHDYTVIANGLETTGLIAQELLETNPGMVHMGDDGYYKVDSYNPWKVLKGIQELSAGQTDLNTSFVTALAKTNGDLAATNELLSAQGIKLDTISTELKALADRVDALEAKNVSQDTEIDELKTQIQQLKQQVNTTQ